LRLITQDSSLIDYNLKSCIGTHIHYKNRNGGEKVSRFQHSQHVNVHSQSELKTVDRQSIITRDKKFYGSYFSAEVHTHKFVMPDYIKKLYIWIPALFVCFFAIYYSISNLSSTVINAEETKKIESISGNPQNLNKENSENNKGLNNEHSQKNSNCTILSSGREY
ncbi:hypothetical protein CGH69_24045, partial [Vibrio parahaemolyticus]